MDQNTNTGTQMPEEKNSTSSIISILVIVLVLALGAFYFLKQVPTPTENGALPPPAAEATGTTDATLTNISAQSTSTDIADIEKDLNATNLSGVDAGLNNISI